MDINPKLKFKQIKIKDNKRLLAEGKQDISLTSIFNSEEFQHIIDCREFRDRIYTPLKTLLIFIKQILSPDKSCKNAVACVVAEQISTGRKAMSANTGPYCKARERLPEFTIKALVNEVGKLSENKASKKWKWHGHEVKLVDGTTIKMPDTKENRQAFLRHNNHAGDVGYPLARLVVIISLAVGTVIDYAIGASKGNGTGEHSLLRSILCCLNVRDILIGDCYYPSFFLISDLISREVDGVFPGLTNRNYDFRCGEFLSKKDHIVEWKKPTKPEWMDKDTYDSYPRQIRVREFKVSGRIYVTTLLNDAKYHKKELAALYEFRWQIELNIRNVKVTMNMDMLSCKTPPMVRKEIGIHFLGYNLIRVLIAEACIKYNAFPLHVSFKGTIQLLNQFTPLFIHRNAKTNEIFFDNLLSLIVKNKVGNRPGRLEPRAVKSEKRKTFPTLKNRIMEKEKLNRQRQKRMLKYSAA